MSISEKRFLVYKITNGKVNTEIQYGQLTTGTDEIKQEGELKRCQIAPEHYEKGIVQLRELYPFNEAVK